MKYYLTTALVLLSVLGYSQSSAESRIRNFLSELKTNTWTFDKMYDKHMQFTVDSMRLNKTIKDANSNAMQFMSQYLIKNQLDVSKLVIALDDKPMPDPKSIDKYDLDPIPFSYKVNDSDKKFVWYFLLTADNKIRSILRFKDNTMFLVY